MGFTYLGVPCDNALRCCFQRKYFFAWNVEVPSRYPTPWTMHGPVKVLWIVSICKFVRWWWRVLHCKAFWNVSFGYEDGIQAFSLLAVSLPGNFTARVWYLVVNISVQILVILIRLLTVYANWFWIPRSLPQLTQKCESSQNFSVYANDRHFLHHCTDVWGLSWQCLRPIVSRPSKIIAFPRDLGIRMVQSLTPSIRLFLSTLISFSWMA